MGITVSWDDQQQTVVRMQFAGEWSLEDFRGANLQTVTLVRSVDHPVYVLSDLRASGDIPLGILWQLRDIAGMRPSNWGGGIALTKNVIIKSVVDVLGRIYMGQQEQRLFVVATEEEAEAVIARLKREDQRL
jgi:hypothetical protein